MQLEHLRRLYAEFYPRLRIYPYTLTEIHTSPFTVFGPQRVALFLGASFLVLNRMEDIRLLSRRFDDLIELAVVQPHQINDAIVTDILSEIGWWISLRPVVPGPTAHARQHVPATGRPATKERP